MKNFFSDFFFSPTRGWLNHGTRVLGICGMSVLGDGPLIRGRYLIRYLL